MQQRRDSHEDMVAKIRKYGVMAVAVLVLVPYQLLVLAGVIAGMVYILIRASQKLAALARA